MRLAGVRPRPSWLTARRGTGTPNRARAVCRPGSAAHPRARASQRPPGGDWRVWGYVGGRGAGKTRAGSGWVQHRVETGIMKLGCLIGPTMADIRDVLVEGPSGLLAVAPPWCRPEFSPSKRRVSWPNGARAICLSGEKPERARGANFDTLWADDFACWHRAEATWDLAMLALRAGTNPQALITTTARRLAVLKRILAEATTVQTTDSTYANQAHLPSEFITQIVKLYENTRLGQQEIYEMLDLLLESGNLLIHPRCTRLRDAFQTYARQRRGGEWIDYPADGHPEEDMIDALRGGVRDAFPECLVPPPNLRPVHAGRVLG